VWLDVPRDTTMMACRLTSFPGMLLDKLYKFKVNILTNNKVLTSLRYMSPMRRDIFIWRGFLTIALFGNILLIPRFMGV